MNKIKRALFIIGLIVAALLNSCVARAEEGCDILAADAMLIVEYLQHGETPEQIKAVVLPIGTAEDVAQEMRLIDEVYRDHNGDLVDVGLKFKKLCEERKGYHPMRQYQRP